jgi:hypothetical protein
MMSTAIIELNDSEIRLATGDNILLRQPGYAVLADNGITTGKPAYAIARSNPRQTYHRYWSQLNQDSLLVPSRLARHHADLAYAQLLAMHEQAGKPQEVVFAVPGNYSREQLALLLGIVQACPFTAVGLVDAATASVAAIAEPGVYTHADIHLHYAVVSTLEVTDHVSRTSVKVINDTGLAAIHETCVASFADAFIDQSRFDPLHHAETEQELYNQIPLALHSLQRSDDLTLEINFKNKRYQARIFREPLLEKLNDHYETIYRELAGTAVPLISDRLHGLPGFSGKPGNAIVVDEQAVFQGCSINLMNIRTAGSALSFITRLPASKSPTINRGNDIATPQSAGREIPTAVTASHLLINHRAYPLGYAAVYVSAGGIIDPDSGSDNRHCSFRRTAAGVEIRPESELTVFVNGNRISAMKIGHAGDTVSFAGSDTVIRLIEVRPD